MASDRGLRSGHTVGLTGNHKTHSAPEVTTKVITAVDTYSYNGYIQ